MVHERLVEELHKSARRNYPRRKYDIRGLDETWQAHLVKMQPYSRENKGYKYLLTVINVFSKFAWAIPIKNKTGENVSIAMKSILSKVESLRIYIPIKVKSFTMQSFRVLCKSIKLICTQLTVISKYLFVNVSTVLSKMPCGKNLVFMVTTNV